MTSNAFLERFRNRQSTLSKLGEVDVSASRPVSTAGIRLISANPVTRTSPKRNITPMSSTPSPIWTQETDLEEKKLSRNNQIRSRESSVDRIRSRVALPQFQPYTLKEYVSIRDQPQNLGGLGPSTVGSEDWRKRKEMQDKKQEYARLIQSKNKSVPKAFPKSKPGLPKPSSARDRALEFSKRVQRPQIKANPYQEAQTSIEVSRNSPLEELEAKHEECLKAVEGIRAQFHV